MAASAKTEFEKTCHTNPGISYNRGPGALTSTAAVAAVVEDSSEVSGKEGNEGNEVSAGITAMTWPSAVALGDSDSDGDSVSSPFTIPNLYWEANMVGHDGFFVKLKQ
jgi:hypothetical protein